ncbi:probable cellulose synthase A catalytic subunit 8 [UDP-forming] isoform X2 [Malania oleifera]|nr:probable cellulose synthase A catalytic subunit 8 [UDP-forming] isoform X2 [Malania oleifera]
MLETLSQTCEFARKWVPFCKKFNIEPRCPEIYFSGKVDNLKYNISPTFCKQRRSMKRHYEEFKIGLNGLVTKFQHAPPEGWTLKDGTPWPGNDPRNHPGMMQILIGSSGPYGSDGESLPQLVYVSREKHPGFQHNKKAGAMNALVRVSAVLTNGAYVLNLNCNHYINSSKAFLEAMCFMMDPINKKKICYVQFPQRFDGTDANDQYTSPNTIFYDINLKGLDGIQGPFYIGTGCFFYRKALYGYDPMSEPKMHHRSRRCPGKKILSDNNAFYSSTYVANKSSPSLLMEEQESPSGFLSMEKRYGSSPSLIASNLDQNDRFSWSTTPDDILREAIHVISCDYEDNTAWGREIGWIYGSQMGDILTGFKMHARGWRSVYHTPACAAFRGTVICHLSDRLSQVLLGATDSIEILLSRHCPIWNGCGGQLKLLERVAYINATMYPLTSIPMLMYSTLPAICLLTGKFIITPITYEACTWVALTLLSVLVNVALEVRWSGINIQEWWRNQQFWVISGLSPHLFAVFQGLGKVAVGFCTSSSWRTEISGEDNAMEFYAFKWTSLLILPTAVILVNLLGMVAGISSLFTRGYGSLGLLFAKLFFASFVVVHLHPFLKGLLVRKHQIPTVVIIWSVLIAAMFSLLWVWLDPFTTRFQGPDIEDCGIQC